METNTKPQSFNFTPDVIEAFTQGDCWVLSLALADHGYPVVTSSFGAHWWNHAANMLPSGHIVDITGIHEAKDWSHHWAVYADARDDEMHIRDWDTDHFKVMTDLLFVQSKTGPMFADISNQVDGYVHEIVSMIA